MSDGQIKAEDNVIVRLRDAIRSAFPAEVFMGKITPYDQDGEWPEELDDDEDIYKTLRGLKWTEVPDEFLQRYPDGFGRLTDTAFIAYFAAWLVRALDDFDRENRVREFIVYRFCDDTRQFRFLDDNRRLLLRSVLEEFSNREPNCYVKERASEAVAVIDAFLAREAKNGWARPSPCSDGSNLRVSTDASDGKADPSLRS